MNEERPIVFTITQVGRLYTLVTKDSRVGTDRPSPEIEARQLVETMKELSAVFNDKGYAVLFEVE